jgi:electron transfer flavoprotein beta subunit
MGYEIVVLVKQVPDLNAVRIDRSTGQPVFSGQLVISSFDEYAIEEALLLIERHGGEITVVTLGPASAKDAITRALAMGADQGVLLQLDSVNELDTLGVAEILAAHLREMSWDIILTGQNSDDSGTGQVAAQVAELLDIPQVSSVTGVSANGKTLTILRDTEDGKQQVEVETPVLLMAMTGLNSPRYPSLKGIMAAKKKPIDARPVDAPHSQTLTWSKPFVQEKSSGGVMIQDVPAAEAAKQLVAWLREKKLI